MNVRNKSGDLIKLIEQIIRDFFTKSKQPRAFFKSVELVEELIKAGADVNMRCRDNYSPLFKLIDYTRSLRIHGFSFEHESCKRIMKTLVENGADSNEIQRNGLSAFVTIILDMKTRISKGDDNLSDYELLDCMIKYGADVTDRRTLYDRTLLMHFCEDQYKRMMIYLIRNGVGINARDDRGQTALMYCVNRNQLEAIDTLLELGADIYLGDFYGITAIELYTSKYSTNLSVAYLKPLCEYFENSTPDKIRLNIDEYLKTRNEEVFPVKKYHLAAIKRLIKERIDSKIESLRYFDSEDFKTKLFADVINQINVENAEIDGQLLIGMRARAKSEQDKDSIDKLISQLKWKEELTREFFTASEELSKLVWNT